MFLPWKLFVFTVAVNILCQKIANSQSVDTIQVYQDAVQYTSDALFYTKDLLKGLMGYGGDQCPFRDSVLDSVRDNLYEHIKGQDEGIDAILNALAGWEFSRGGGRGGGGGGHSPDISSSSQNHAPLVLAITGPTGVGKSETAFRLAEAALAKAQRVGYSTRFLPNGLLMLRGEDFSAAAIGATLGSTPSSKAAAGGGGSGGGGGYVSGGWSESDTAQAAAEARHIIKSRIVEHLKTCQGNAVIVFDEVQKVLPGTLEVLMPALDERGSLSSSEYVRTSRDSTASQISSYVSSLFGAATSQLTATSGSSGSTGNGRSEYVDRTGSTDTSSSTATSAGSASTPSHSTSFSWASGEEAEERLDGERANMWDDRKYDYKLVSHQYSTANCIFLFISDIGADMMTKLLLTYGNRSAIPQSVLRNEVKSALDSQWERLRFGKTIKEVVPFLPLEPEHVREVLTSKLRKLSDRSRHSHWLELAVDEAVVHHITGPQFIKYSVYNAKRPKLGPKAAASTAGTADTADSDFGVTISKSETRSTQVETDGKREPETIESRFQPGRSTSSSSNSGGNSNSGSSSKVFATWGARALENAGPLQDLRSLLHRKVRSWRPDEILHIGLATEANRATWAHQWGVKHSDQSQMALPQVYLQWCRPQPGMAMPQRRSQQARADHRPPPPMSCGDDAESAESQQCRAPLGQSSPGAAAGDGGGGGGRVGGAGKAEADTEGLRGPVAYNVTEEFAFSEHCETIWFGKFHGSASRW